MMLVATSFALACDDRVFFVANLISYLNVEM